MILQNAKFYSNGKNKKIMEEPTKAVLENLIKITSIEIKQKRVLKKLDIR